MTKRTYTFSTFVEFVVTLKGISFRHAAVARTYAQANRRVAGRAALSPCWYRLCR